MKDTGNGRERHTPVDTPAEQDATIETVTRKVTADKKQARRNRSMLESQPILKRDEIVVEDIELTREVLRAAELFGISVHDHIIIGKGAHYSLKANGKI